MHNLHAEFRISTYCCISFRIDSSARFYFALFKYKSALDVSTGSRSTMEEENEAGEAREHSSIGSIEIAHMLVEVNDCWLFTYVKQGFIYRYCSM